MKDIHPCATKCHNCYSDIYHEPFFSSDLWYEFEEGSGAVVGGLSLLLLFFYGAASGAGIIVSFLVAVICSLIFNFITSFVVTYWKRILIIIVLASIFGW
jgi:VIT1/CCC1 family predicted Fe2+/Mn2+ transporter